MVDLGEWWEQETNLPIPLGAIIARRSLDLSSITGWIRASVRYAWAHPKESKDYILLHSQEMSDEVTQAHIKLYVNEFTENIGELGYKAVNSLLSKASQYLSLIHI